MFNFKRFLALAALLAAVSPIFAQEAAAPAIPEQEPVIEETECAIKPTFGISADWANKYLSHGTIYNSDPVLSLNFYAGLETAFGTPYINIWSQMDMTDFNRPERSDYLNNRKWRAEEIDYTIGYAYTFETDFSPLTLDISWNYYQYPRYRPESERRPAGRGHFHETPLAFVLTLDNVLTSFTDEDSAFALAIGNAFRYDYTHYHWDAEFFADFSYAATDKLVVGLKNTWYYGGKRYYETGSSVIAASEVKLYGDYQITDNISVGAFVAGSWFVDSRIRNEAREDELNNRQNFWTGLSVAFNY